MNYARRESLSRCPETCPAVDAAFSDFLSDIKDAVAPRLLDGVEREAAALCNIVKNEGTEKLRAVLESVIEEKFEVESERDALQKRVDELENLVGSMEDEVADLIRQLDEVSA